MLTESAVRSQSSSPSGRSSIMLQPFRTSPEPMTKQQREQGLRQLSFPQPMASHMGMHQPGSSQFSPRWQDPPLLTPREVAVEQLLSHKLQAATDQERLVSIQFAQPQSPVSIQSSKPGSPAMREAAISSGEAASHMPQVICGSGCSAK